MSFIFVFIYTIFAFYPRISLQSLEGKNLIRDILIESVVNVAETEGINFEIVVQCHLG